MSIYIDNFETIYGTKGNIQALRNKVLELAIRGKLSEQDANDEPASELIKKVKIEKNKLVLEGKIKKDKSLAPIESVEEPFEIADNWIWVKAGEIFNIKSASRIHETDWRDSGIPFYRGRELVKLAKHGTVNSEIFIDETFYNDLVKKSGIPKKDDILVSAVGTLGKVYIVKETDKFYYKDAYILCFENYGALYAPYFKVLLECDDLQKQIKKDSMATTVAQLTIARANNLLMPLPPIQEQHRIVARVESLMAEIDKLEEYLQNKVRLMRLLPQAVVDAIGSCKNGEELKEQLQFVVSNFETIFQTPESMQDLKNVILQLAIEGKLVPQDPNDEPASELIKKIQAEKDELVKEGKLKKQNPASPIQDDEIPFVMPDNWQWAKLGDVANLVMGQSPDGELVTGKVGEGIEFHQGKTNFDKKYLKDSGKYTKYPTKLAPQNSLLISVRAPVGTLNYTNRDICIGRGLAALIPFSGVHLDYLFFAVTALQGWLIENATGTTFKAITGDVLSSLLIPIPPLAEQQRIVAKVESIMVLIDQMEAEMKRKVDLVEKMASA